MEKHIQCIAKYYILCFKFYDPSNYIYIEKKELIKEGSHVQGTSILIWKIQSHI